MMTIRFLFCLLATTFDVIGQDKAPSTEYFEGCITYQHRWYDAQGERLSVPVDVEKEYFTKHQIFNEVISGPSIPYFGKNQYFLDIDKGVRYAVDHDRKTMRDIGIPDDKDFKLDFLKETQMPDEKILGHLCEVHVLKYIKKYRGPFEPEVDTVTHTFYSSKEFKIFRPDLFAFLQSNKSSSFLDGRYEGVPLKMVMKKEDGSYFVTEATNIKELNVTEEMNLDSYTVEH